MKNYIIFILSTFNMYLIHAQSINICQEQARSNLLVNNSIITNNNSVISAGGTDYYSGNMGLKDIYLQITDANGNSAFSLSYYSTVNSIDKKNEVITDIFQSEDGNYIACGNLNKNTTEPFGANSDYQSFILKISPTGTILGQVVFSNPNPASPTYSKMQTNLYRIIKKSDKEAIGIGSYTYRYNNIDYNTLFVIDFNYSLSTFPVAWSKIYIQPFDQNNPSISKYMNAYLDGNNLFITNQNRVYNLKSSDGTILSVCKLSAPNSKIIDISGITPFNNLLAISGSLSKDSYTNKNTVFINYLDKNLNANRQNAPQRFGSTIYNLGVGNRLSNQNGELYMSTYRFDNSINPYEYTPELVKLSNNNLYCSIFNKSKYQNDFTFNCSDLFKDNNGKLFFTFNTNSYSNTANFNKFFLSSTMLNQNNCNSISAGENLYTNSIRIEPDNIEEVKISVNLEYNYFPVNPSIINTTSTNFNCCSNPELLKWGNFEGPFRPTICFPNSFESFMTGWMGSSTGTPTCSGTGLWNNTSVGTQWIYQGNLNMSPYGNSKSKVTQNTLYSNNVTYNASNPIYNNFVYLVDFEYQPIILNWTPINKTIWKQNFSAAAGDYLLAIDFGTADLRACNNNSNFEIILTDINNNTSTSLGLYNPKNNCLNNNNLGLTDICIRMSLNNSNYSIALVLRNATSTNEDYVLDNISIKRICSTCNPYNGKMINENLQTENVSFKNELNVFPNPVSDIVNFQFESQADSKASLYIYNILGNITDIILNENSLTTGIYIYKMDVSNYQTGIYFAILDLNGQKYTSKFVIHR